MSLRMYDIISTFQRLVVKSIPDKSFRKWSENLQKFSFGGDNDGKDGNDGERDEKEEDIGLSVERKIQILQKQDKRIVMKEIKKWNTKQIRRVFYRFMSHPDQTKSSKIGIFSMINSLTSLFYKNNVLIQKRVEENENLKRIDLSHHALFIRCGKTDLPCEIVSQIISFVGYNKWTIMKIGSISWTFYLILFKHWRRINITPQNLYSIPLLVLRNSRFVKINLENSMCFRIRMFQCNYIYDQLQNVKTLEIDIGGKFQDVKRFFRHLRSRKEKNMKKNGKFDSFYPFLHLTDLKFSGCLKLMHSKWEKEWDSICLKSLFPRIRTLKETPSLYILKNYETTLTNLWITLEMFENNLEIFLHSGQIPFLPSSVKKLRVSNVSCMMTSGGCNDYIKKFVELIGAVRKRCEDLSVFVCRSGKDHSENEVENGRIGLINYFGNWKDGIEDGVLEMKDWNVVKMGYYRWNRRIVKRVRLVWKKKTKF